MPRPSDLYATLGAPGVYQSTPCSPNILPNVFLIPPAEDSQDVYCLFHSGSASPTSYDPFYRDPTTRRDPSRPMTNVAALDQALSLIHHQVTASAGAAVFGRRSVWQQGQPLTISPRNSGPRSYSSDTSPFGTTSSGTGATALPNVRFLLEMERYLDSHEEQTMPARPSSRRSSIFGERPSEHDIFPESVPEEEEERMARTKKSQNMTLRSRAAIALKAIGGVKVKRAESDVGSEGGDEVGHRHALNSKQPKRRTLVQLFSSNSSVDVSVSHPQVAFAPAGRSSSPTPSASTSKLTKRKSMTQIFGFARIPRVDAFEMQNPRAGWDQTTVIRPSSPPSKLSKRKSVAHLFGLGRGISSTPALAVLSPTSDGNVDSSYLVEANARLAALRALEGPLASQPDHSAQSTNPSLHHSVTAPSLVALHQLSERQVSPVSSPLPDSASMRRSRRKSFFRGHPFSILDLHRNMSSCPESGSRSQIRSTGLSQHSVTPSVSESPSPPLETMDSSSSNPASTDSEPEVEDAVQVFAPRLGVHSPSIPCVASDGNGVIDLSSTIQLDADGKDDVPSWVDNLEPNHIDIEGDEEGSSLELTARLDSLTFDRLTFDPESFAGAGRV